MNLSIKDKLNLNNGEEIPQLGLGVYLSGKGKPTYNSVRWALETGYRHIDTAAMYGNEDDVGRAVTESDLKREDIFVTTKLWNSDHGYDRAIKAFNKSLELLGLEYVDLYLIHWPVANERKNSWKALETIHKEGRAKSIGVSNYTISHVKELLDYAEVKPVVNQVEFHPFLYQKELQEFCESNDIYLEAYSPLTKGYKLEDPVILKIAKNYKKSSAQIMIRWSLQRGVIVLPKSSNAERIRENADVYDFSIDKDDMKLLDSLNKDWHCTWDPTDTP